MADEDEFYAFIEQSRTALVWRWRWGVVQKDRRPSSVCAVRNGACITEKRARAKARRIVEDLNKNAIPLDRSDAYLLVIEDDADQEFEKLKQDLQRRRGI
jgi:ABC-type phosphonate transport system ATPase subunit